MQQCHAQCACRAHSSLIGVPRLPPAIARCAAAAAHRTYTVLPPGPARSAVGGTAARERKRPRPCPAAPKKETDSLHTIGFPSPRSLRLWRFFRHRRRTSAIAAACCSSAPLHAPLPVCAAAAQRSRGGRRGRSRLCCVAIPFSRWCLSPCPASYLRSKPQRTHTARRRPYHLSLSLSLSLTATRHCRRTAAPPSLSLPARPDHALWQRLPRSGPCASCPPSPRTCRSCSPSRSSRPRSARAPSTTTRRRCAATAAGPPSPTLSACCSSAARRRRRSRRSSASTTLPCTTSWCVARSRCKRDGEGEKGRKREGGEESALEKGSDNAMTAPLVFQCCSSSCASSSHRRTPHRTPPVWPPQCDTRECCATLWRHGEGDEGWGWGWLHIPFSSREQKKGDNEVDR